jgi:hypothetical protein
LVKRKGKYGKCEKKLCYPTSGSTSSKEEKIYFPILEEIFSILEEKSLFSFL